MQRAFLLHALSPLHAGTGQAASLIDLPLARLKATGIPYLPGSSIKGVLRDSARPAPGDPPDPPTEEWKAFFSAFGSDFGSNRDHTEDHAGAVLFGDARLLLLPVRSLRGTFAYVTSPLLLRLASQDLEAAGAQALPDVPLVAAAGVLLCRTSVLDANGKVYLEDLDLDVATAAAGQPHPPDATSWGKRLASLLFDSKHEAQLTERFAIVDDETMTFLWETATQVDARVRLDPETRVAADKALWYEESLPAESVLIGLAAAMPSKRKGYNATAADLLDDVLAEPRNDLQFGGKASVGRGRARLLPVT